MGVWAGRRVFVAGHGGLAGSALVRALSAQGASVLSADRRELDLADGSAVAGWMAAHRPEVILLAAGRAGGVAANIARPTAFLRENLLIPVNVMEAAWRAGCRRLVFLASSCAYPLRAPQPLREEDWLAGAPEPSNAAHAAAKRAGVELARAYRTEHGLAFQSVAACNLYGPGDRFDTTGGHVIPALMRRAVEARRAGAAELVVWGSGRPRREFLHADDLARAILTLAAAAPAEDLTNIGSGEEVTVAELAATIAEVAGFRARLSFDASRPDGSPGKRLDSSRMRARGWRPRIGLREGLADVHASYLSAEASGRVRGGWTEPAGAAGQRVGDALSANWVGADPRSATR